MTSTKGEMAVRESTAVATAEELTIDQLVAQTRKIQEAMAAVMRSGEHYGVIPGTDKPTLLKPGAEKLCLLFRLDPRYEILSAQVSEDLVHYVVRCTLVHIQTENEIATGIGSCNSREKKYRWRMEPTGEAPPNKETQERMKAAGTGGFRKIRGAWAWCVRVEADPYEFDNTILKMAQKRALVAAVLNGTAASDIFTQDLEDLPTVESAPAKVTVSEGTYDKLMVAIGEAAATGDGTWQPETVLLNARRKWGSDIQSFSDLTDQQAQAIIDAAKAVADEGPVDAEAEEIPFGE